MRTTVPEDALARADGPDPARPAKGFFAFGETHLRGLAVAYWLLLLYVFIGLAAIDEEWEVVARLRPRLLLGSIVLLVVVARIVSAALTSRRGPSPPDAVTAWWGAYFGATLLAAVWAFDPSLAKEALLNERLTALLCFPLMVAMVRTRREFLVLILVFCLAYGFYLIRSYQEFLSGRHDATMGVVRMVGAGSRNADPNSFAATVVFSLPLLLWAGIHTRSLVLRLCVTFYGLLATTAVVLTRSRAGLILLALAALWFVWVLPNWRARILGVLLLVAAAGMASMCLSERAIQRYVGMFTGGSTASERESTEGRIRGYQVAWEIFQENPVLGVGPGNWATYRMRRVDGSTLLPHSLPGQLLATLGMVGTLAFVGLLLATLVRAGRETRRRKGMEDPWERAVRSLAGAMVFTLFLLLVSGLAAHNLGRWTWTWAPALLVVATTCRLEVARVGSPPQARS